MYLFTICGIHIILWELFFFANNHEIIEKYIDFKTL